MALPMRIFLAAILLVLLGEPLQAQWGGGSSGGRFTPTLSYSYIDGHDGEGELERHWLTAIIVWRDPRPTTDMIPGPPSEMQRQAILRYRALEAAAQDAHRYTLGGSRGTPVRWAEYDGTTLYILGRRYALPLPPVALVVVVDLGEFGDTTSTIVYRGTIPSTMPDPFWPRHWKRGDTLMTYPGARDKDGMLLAHLRSDSTIAKLLP